MFVIVVNNTCFLKTVQKVRKGNALLKKGVALKFYDEREGKLFSPAFCLFSEGLLTSMAGLVMASLWIHGVHRAAGSGPGRATGCLAFSGHGL